MHKPCQCLPWVEGGQDKSSGYYTIVKVRSMVDSGKAILVHFTKQTLPNGVEIPTGYKMWIPHYLCLRIDSILKQVGIANIKLNEVIRTINIDKIKKK
jgi:hypothetical protein